ncbi:hypothetical protein F2Q70_00015674 [Brassica cretica]|nr:hypothetical protein F2Q70_00015674 [Brassica cretica]KAF2600327.1 hypothetical protein F2Q68_00008592 [Brassica cretica]
MSSVGRHAPIGLVGCGSVHRILSDYQKEKLKKNLRTFRHRRVSVCHICSPALSLTLRRTSVLSLAVVTPHRRVFVLHRLNLPTLPSPPPLPPPEQAAFRRELVPLPCCLLYPTKKLEYTGEHDPFLSDQAFCNLASRIWAWTFIFCMSFCGRLPYKPVLDPLHHGSLQRPPLTFSSILYYSES